MGTSEIQRYPANTSSKYIEARDELLKAEWALRDQAERVAELRRNLPVGAPMAEYAFKEGPSDLNQSSPVKTTTLADLAADGRSVVIYHLMFGENEEGPCSMCSMAVDGFNGVAKHLNEHVNFAVIAKCPVDKLRAYGKKRGWDRLRLLSSSESTFNKDMHVENAEWAPDSYQLPGISVFRKDPEGDVKHVYTMSAHFDDKTVRGTDFLVPVWGVLDLIPEGRGNWNASNEYIF
jgi:predicted dithiol-disulfide oxidoreductase (DUF899 family)